MEIQPEKMDNVRGKPEFLYHASQRQGIVSLQPRKESVRDPHEGEVVFGTPDKAYATMFLVDADDSWVQRGFLNGVPHIVISDRERFAAADHGGTLYRLPSDPFDSDPEKNMGDKEWVSKGEVAPIDGERFQSGLEAMIENGVQVFFTDAGTYARMRNADDYGMSIVKRLVSENQKQGMNIVSF